MLKKVALALIALVALVWISGMLGEDSQVREVHEVSHHEPLVLKNAQIRAPLGRSWRDEVAEDAEVASWQKRLADAHRKEHPDDDPYTDMVQLFVIRTKGNLEYQERRMVARVAGVKKLDMYLPPSGFLVATTQERADQLMKIGKVGYVGFYRPEYAIDKFLIKEKSQTKTPVGAPLPNAIAVLAGPHAQDLVDRWAVTQLDPVDSVHPHTVAEIVPVAPSKCLVRWKAGASRDVRHAVLRWVAEHPHVVYIEAEQIMRILPQPHGARGTPGGTLKPFSHR